MRRDIEMTRALSAELPIIKVKSRGTSGWIRVAKSPLEPMRWMANTLVSRLSSRKRLLRCLAE